ncbi:MAG: [acyl-carrier-protein] S-malonyltransferase [Firmicutes bacterium HGW-Firmicutes-14]|nr:MAG: [acyl-carrier-protein] S-malonyltransferase [Firmicutes bacterium HGW-Firmicutes-14]
MKTAFIFPGQGSQYVGMGKDLYENYIAAREILEEANDVLGFDLMKICFEGPEEELKNTSITQPAILAVSTACLAILEEKGVKPAAVAGHSLGEYSALLAAGAIGFPQALELVRKRGLLMEENAPEGGMAAVLGLEKESVLKACEEASKEGVVEIANYNCPGQIVIAGESGALEKAMELAKSFGAKRVIALQVSGPFHSSLMTEASRKLEKELEKIDFSVPRCPVISNVTADIVSSAKDIGPLLVRQVKSSVRWEECMERLNSMDVKFALEVGPGKVLTGLGKKIIRDGRLLFNNVEDLASLEKTLDNFEEVI